MKSILPILAYKEDRQHIRKTVIQPSEQQRVWNKSTLNKVGHFVNGVISNTLMIAGMQPIFTWKTYRMNGLPLPRSLPALFNGMLVNASSGAPAEGIAFVAENQLSSQNPISLRRLGVSCLAGAMGAPITAALERIAIQQQLHGRSAFKNAKAIYTSEGILRGIFKGTVPTIGRDMCYNVGIFALSDIIHEQLKTAGIDSITLSSALSGAAAGVCSTPFDVVKTRMQSTLHGELRSTYKTITCILSREGIRSLFQGVGIRSALIAGCTVLINSSKEYLPSYLPKSLHQ